MPDRYNPRIEALSHPGSSKLLRAPTSPAISITASAAIALAIAIAPHANAQDQYREVISNDMSKCAPEKGPAVRVSVTNIKSATGKVRVQLYRGTKEDWLESGRWLHRIEVPARQGAMTFCLPLPEAGTFAVAARHDANDNGKTDITKDGGAMSNNPSINIFNLGRPSYKKTRFEAGSGVSSITIRMRYF